MFAGRGGHNLIKATTPVVRRRMVKTATDQLGGAQMSPVGGEASPRSGQSTCVQRTRRHVWMPIAARSRQKRMPGVRRTRSMEGWMLRQGCRLANQTSSAGHCRAHRGVTKSHPVWAFSGAYISIRSSMSNPDPRSSRIQSPWRDGIPPLGRIPSSCGAARPVDAGGGRWPSRHQVRTA